LWHWVFDTEANRFFLEHAWAYLDVSTGGPADNGSDGIEISAFSNEARQGETQRELLRSPTGLFQDRPMPEGLQGQTRPADVIGSRARHAHRYIEARRLKSKNGSDTAVSCGPPIGRFARRTLRIRAAKGVTRSAGRGIPRWLLS
jgi:hypothetical protein